MNDSLIQILRRGVVAANARGNKNKNQNKRKRKNGNGNLQQQIQVRCVSQIPGCEALANDSCGDNAACKAAIRICCQSLGTCEFTEFFICANAALGAGN